jgi:hypothetical protein
MKIVTTKDSILVKLQEKAAAVVRVTYRAPRNKASGAPTTIKSIGHP